MTTTATPPDAAKAAKPKGKKRMFILIALVLVVLVGGYEVMGKKSHQKKPTSAVQLKPGPLVPVDAVTVNLAGGHYLRIGLALQFSTKTNKNAPPDPAPATDATIQYFTGKDPAGLQTPAGLERAKEDLTKQIAEVYPHDPILEVLFTSFVIQ